MTAPHGVSSERRFVSLGTRAGGHPTAPFAVIADLPPFVSTEAARPLGIVPCSQEVRATA